MPVAWQGDMIDKGPICISVINMKGGVGKTTIATLLGRHAATQRNLKTLAVDLDPQANLSQALLGAIGYRRFLDSRAPSIVEIFRGHAPPASGNPSPSPLDVDDVVRRIRPNLHLIPSRFDFSQHLVNSIGTDPQVLARLIADNFQDKDLVIIDCAPTESIFTRTAYHASGYILVPVKPEFLATIGFPMLSRSLMDFSNANPGHSISVAGVVVNDTSDYQAYSTPEKNTALSEIHDEASENGWYVFKHGLRYSRGFPKAMRSNSPNWPGHAPHIFSRFADELFDERLVP